MAEAGSDKRFTGSGGAHQNDIKVLLQPLTFPELTELLLADAVKKGVIIPVQVMIYRQLCCTESSLQVGSLGRGIFQADNLY